TYALQRRGRDHALRGAADAHQQVDAGRGLRGRDRRSDVAVRDQVYLAAGLAQLVDPPPGPTVNHPLLPIPLEHYDRDLARPPPLRLRDAGDVLSRRRVDVDGVDRL